jgi:hypothetical protein
VLFEASTTSGSNVPEGNERVVCSGLFYIFFEKRKKNQRVCFVLKTNNALEKKKKLFVKFFFFFFFFFLFFKEESCKYTKSKNITKVQFFCKKCVKQKKRKSKKLPL